MFHKLPRIVVTFGALCDVKWEYIIFIDLLYPIWFQHAVFVLPTQNRWMIQMPEIVALPTTPKYPGSNSHWEPGYFGVPVCPYYRNCIFRLQPHTHAGRLLARATHHHSNMMDEIGFSPDSQNEYKCWPCIHIYAYTGTVTLHVACSMYRTCTCRHCMQPLYYVHMYIYWSITYSWINTRVMYCE